MKSSTIKKLIGKGGRREAVNRQTQAQCSAPSQKNKGVNINGA